MFYFLHFLANFLLLSFHSANGRFSSLSIEEDLQLEKELKSLNKPPLKTIKVQTIYYYYYYYIIGDMRIQI